MNRIDRYAEEAEAICASHTMPRPYLRPLFQRFEDEITAEDCEAYRVGPGGFEKIRAKRRKDGEG